MATHEQLQATFGEFHRASAILKMRLANSPHSEQTEVQRRKVQALLLKQTLEDYCFARGITGEHERDNVASSILRLFGRGLTSPEEITAALEDISTEQSRRQA
jgi:hypothetical protein